jgi:hypothetical protein
MRLFHVSEEPGIDKFVPRLPKRQDMDQSVGLVWALTEPALPNFLTPRDCPRVGYRVGEGTATDDIARFFSSSLRHCVAIEQGWHKRMLETTLYVYEFDPANFRPGGGFYVSEQTETPITMAACPDLYAELFRRGAEVRLLDNLWPLANAVKDSSLMYSLCRMANAIPAIP